MAIKWIWDELVYNPEIGIERGYRGGGQQQKRHLVPGEKNNKQKYTFEN